MDVLITKTFHTAVSRDRINIYIRYVYVSMYICICIYIAQKPPPSLSPRSSICPTSNRVRPPQRMRLIRFPPSASPARKSTGVCTPAERGCHTKQLRDGTERALACIYSPGCDMVALLGLQLTASKKMPTAPYGGVRHSLHV